MPDDGRAKGVDFNAPPLSEVVFSVQFAGNVIDEVGTLAEFWPKIRTQYPGHDKQPPLPPATEIFETPAAGPELQFQVMHGAPPQRYWFLSEDGTQIVQVQNDRLMFNWRQVSGSETYPRYATLAPQFAQLLETFLTCESVDREAAEVTWVELQYVNPINAPGFDGTHGQLARILNFLVEDPPRMTLSSVEDTQLQQRFRILDDQKQPQGRLYLSAVPGWSREGNPVYLLTLLARGRPRPGSLVEGVSGFLAKAHDLIVNGFKEVTTSAMHEAWGVR
jgi:uncharacterized protein (TIGR04255 family)